MVSVGFFATFFFALYCASVRFMATHGAGMALRSRALLSFFSVPLMTRRVYRWNEVRDVFDWLAFKTTHTAMMESRSALYCLFGILPVYYRLYSVEVPAVVKAGSAINNGSHVMDPYFPVHLAYCVPA